MSDLRVSEIWRYPVKSIGGERVAMATVTELGIVGDRAWGIYHGETDTVLTARRSPELLFASASLNGADVAITLPDGSIVNGEDADADERLSAWLGKQVELRAAGETGGTYEVPLDFENDENWVSWTGPAGAWHDSTKSRVSLLSRGSLGDWDQRRFRSNIILDGSGEDDLVGSSVAIGSDLVLDVKKRIDRCVIVTRPQPGLERDIDVLKTINADYDTCLSVGALITAGGTIAEGDTITTT